VSGCVNSRTPLRRALTALAPARPPRWLTPRMAWAAYALLEWAAWRAQELAMELEDAS
jgi:hypothetical protein